MFEALFRALDPTQFFDPSTQAGPLYAAFIVLEISLIQFIAARGQYETRDTSASITMGAGSAVFGILFGSFGFAALFWVYEHRVLTVPTNLFTLVLLFIIDDFRYYWSHRFSHRIRWFWANHVVHHSSQHFNLSTALRQPWFSTLSGLVLLNIPLVLLGAHPAALAFVASFNLVYQFFIHTEAVGRLPRAVEAVFNTPSHHRVHHSTRAEHLDMNYAGVFIIWDKMFKTFIDEDDEGHENPPIQYGIIHNLGTFNPLRISCHEYVSILTDCFQKGLSWRQRFAYFFAPPGWSHDGSRETSEMIKQRQKYLLD